MIDDDAMKNQRTQRRKITLDKCAPSRDANAVEIYGTSVPESEGERDRRGGLIEPMRRGQY